MILPTDASVLLYQEEL